MTKLWDWVNSKKISYESKVSVFLFLNCLKYSLLGFLIWVLVSRFALNTWEWAICFVGYPGFFIGYIGGLIFLCQQ